jgi:hypothetical protein
MVETIQWGVRRAVVIVIPSHTRNAHAPNDIQALLGVVVISNDVTEAGYMSAILRLDVCQHGFQGGQIRMYVS